MTQEAIEGQLGALSRTLPFLHGALCRVADERGVTTISDLQRQIGLPVRELLRLGVADLSVRELCALAVALGIPAHELLYLAVPEACGSADSATDSAVDVDSGTSVS